MCKSGAERYFMKRTLYSAVFIAFSCLLLLTSGCCKCSEEATKLDIGAEPDTNQSTALGGSALETSTATYAADSMKGVQIEAEIDARSLSRKVKVLEQAGGKFKPDVVEDEGNALVDAKSRNEPSLKQDVHRKTELKKQSKPFWVVEKFTESKTWLKPHPSLAKLDRQWGNELSQAIRKALTRRSLTVESVSSKLTDKQINQLASEGMKYLCGGSLQSLARTDSAGKRIATLSVVYELKRSSGTKTRLVQKERLSFSLGLADKTIGEADLQSLIETAADAIAGRIVEHIPSDLAASRG